MKIFQNSGIYSAYLPQFNSLAIKANSFLERVNIFLEDAYLGAHTLLPIHNRTDDAFFTNGDDKLLQRLWAGEHGMRSNTSLLEILLAQIEEHQADIFYNLDPIRYDSRFIRKLPGCVKSTIAWRGVLSAHELLEGYDLVVCNFPNILKIYRSQGLRAEYFAPSHDPRMDIYATNVDRPIDVLFIGGYSRHHLQRSLLLEVVSRLQDNISIIFHLDCSRLTNFSESIFGQLLPLSKYRRPSAVSAISRPPIFGLDLYSAISNAKIVINGAIDLPGNDRGNLRCFEATGCGALMISDEGSYPDGFTHGKTMLTYADPLSAADLIDEILCLPECLSELAASGNNMVQTFYSKELQWQNFMKLVESL